MKKKRKRIPATSTVFVASKEGVVHVCITLDDKFEDEGTAEEREAVLEDLGNYGNVVGNYSWDPTNIGLDCPVDKALELIELYRQDKVDYISEIFVPRTKIRPCYRRTA